MDRQDSQNLNSDAFYRPPVSSVHVLISTERYPDNSLLLNFDDDEYSHVYGQINKLLKLLQKITFVNHIYLKMTLDRQMMTMILDIICTLSKYDTRKFMKIFNQ